MIDHRQVRAARGLLNWSQDELAKQSGIARATIKNFENGLGVPRWLTANSLQRTFEESGVEFLPNSGVRMKDKLVVTHVGREANKLLVEDIYDCLKATGGEILIAFLNEERALEALGAEYLAEQMRLRKEANITHRLLIRSDEKFITAALDTYRIVPDEYFSSHPFFIYSERLALLSPDDPEPRVIIIRDARFAESARRLFDFVWDRTEMPSQKKVTKL